jgi:hypothetical protein
MPSKRKSWPLHKMQSERVDRCLWHPAQLAVGQLVRLCHARVTLAQMLSLQVRKKIRSGDVLGAGEG